MFVHRIPEDTKSCNLYYKEFRTLHGFQSCNLNNEFITLHGFQAQGYD